MSTNKSEIERVQATISKSLHEHWTLFLVEGTILVVLGLVAVMVPMVATLAVEKEHPQRARGYAGRAVELLTKRAPHFAGSAIPAAAASIRPRRII